jgi:hypothetical protein
MLKFQEPSIAPIGYPDKLQSGEPDENGDIVIFASEDEIKAHAKVKDGAGNLAAVSSGPQKAHSSKWGKGTSGNPAGRPRGSRNKVTVLVEQLLENQAEELVQKAIASALEGDPHTLRLFIDRLVPRCKEPAIQFELGPTKTLDQVKAAMSNLLEAIASGQVRPDQGLQIMTMLHFKLDLELGVLYCK